MAPNISISTLFITYTLLTITLMHKCTSQDFEPSPIYEPPLTCDPPFEPLTAPIYPHDVDLLQFAVNLEHLECDYFLWGALGFGLDEVAPYLTWGGPPPIGAQVANLDSVTYGIIREFAFEEVDHLRALKGTVGGFPRPLLDLSPYNFAKIFDEAMGYKLNPPFNPYRDSLSYMLSAYCIPYMGLVGYAGANPLIDGHVSKRLLIGLMGVESGQDAVIRMYLYERKDRRVPSYNHTVAEFTARISDLRNRLAGCGVKDEGLIVPPWLGAYNLSETNVLSANYYSLSYRRTPAEILRVVYGTGDEHIPGGFYPEGGNGKIAREYLDEQYRPEALTVAAASVPKPQPRLRPLTATAASVPKPQQRLRPLTVAAASVPKPQPRLRPLTATAASVPKPQQRLRPLTVAAASVPKPQPRLRPLTATAASVPKPQQRLRPLTAAAASVPKPQPRLRPLTTAAASVPKPQP